MAANENGGNRQNRLKLMFLSVMIGVMHGGTAGALTGFAFAIYLAVVDARNIGITMFLYFIAGVFYSFFVGGLAGTLNGVVSIFTNLVSRRYIGLNCLIAGLVALLPVFLLQDLSMIYLCLLTSPVTAIFVTRQLHRLFAMYHPISA